MRNTDYLVSFLAGAGIGVAASVLIGTQAGDKNRRIRDIASRAGDVVNERAEKLGPTRQQTVLKKLNGPEEMHKRKGPKR